MNLIIRFEHTKAGIQPGRDASTEYVGRARRLRCCSVILKKFTTITITAWYSLNRMSDLWDHQPRMIWVLDLSMVNMFHSSFVALF